LSELIMNGKFNGKKMFVEKLQPYASQVNHGYLPDLPQQELREGQGRGYEHDLEPAQPAR